MTVAPLIVGRALMTEVRLIVGRVGMREVPLTADRAGTIGLGQAGPGPGMMTGLGRGETTALDRAGTTGPGRAGTTGPGRRVRRGVGGGRIAARVVAIALRERSASADPAGTRTRRARAATIRRSLPVSPALSWTVRSRPSCGRYRGALLTSSRSTWSPPVG
jgi:hypothetical protein